MTLALSFLLLTVPAPALGAGANELTDGAVAPTDGTTDTTFVFSVTYTSGQGRDATRVVARVANTAVALALATGTSTNGTYRGSSRLPEGTWPVTFQATASQGKDPTLPGPTVTVQPVAAPAPTQAPPPAAPAPAPVAPAPVVPVPVAPAPVPPAAPPAPAETPVAVEAPVATGGLVAVTVTGEVISSAGNGEASVAAEGWVVAGDQPWAMMGVGLLGILAMAAVAYFAAGRKRRPTYQAAPAAAAPPVRRASQVAAPPPPPPARRPRADWELYAGLDNEPIGTVGLRHSLLQEGSDLPVNSPSASGL